MAFAAALLCAQNKQPGKPAGIEVIDASAHREGSSVNIDGKLRNSGEKPVKKLKVFIAFRDPDGKTISTRTGGIEQKVFEPDDEVEFHAQVPDSVRAVDIVFNFEDAAGHELNAVNPGPFTIE